MAGQEILKQGCCWRVGNGSAIRVTKDKWIPNHPMNKVIHPPREDEWEWRVVELIDWTTRTWDRNLIEAMFHRDDAEAILRILLSRRYTDDTLFWLHNRKGKYTVKSGYHVARQIWREAQSKGECSTGTGVSPVWGKIWKLHIPNKIKVSGWHACQNILPTRDNLARRHIVEDSTCELYKRAKESVLHVLWECSVGVDVWAGSTRRLQKSMSVQTDFRQLVEDMIRKLLVEEVELFLVQAWMIWTQRNVVTNGGTLQDPSQLVKRASIFLDDFRASQEQLAVSNPVVREARWVPPPGNCFKLNFDAAIFQDLQASGFGAIIRNAN